LANKWLAALSDNESSGDEQIPPQKKGKQTKVAKAAEEPEEDESEDDDEGLDE
jgi:chromobox protein 1